MGYTHYWTQTRSFTLDEWTETSADIREILTYVENLCGVPLADGAGDGGTRPEFTDRHVMFNGVGEDAHETFVLLRTRAKAWPGGCLGADFTKTARKPYDIAVTACLCYLASVSETHSVSSDGKGANFVAGLDAARKALPRKANILDIPMDIMRDDRWTGPWVNGHDKSGFDINFCIDGMAYVQKKSTKEWYRFETHVLMAEFLNRNKYASFRRGGSTGFGSYPSHENDIWNATGSFDGARHARIAKAQAKVLRTLFPVDGNHAFPPPAYVRPGDMPRPEEAGTFCYSLSDLLNKIAA